MMAEALRMWDHPEYNAQLLSRITGVKLLSQKPQPLIEINVSNKLQLDWFTRQVKFRFIIDNGLKTLEGTYDTIHNLQDAPPYSVKIGPLQNIATGGKEELGEWQTLEIVICARGEGLRSRRSHNRQQLLPVFFIGPHLVKWFKG